jgi:hypothetical protein
MGAIETRSNSPPPANENTGMAPADCLSKKCPHPDRLENVPQRKPWKIESIKHKNKTGICHLLLVMRHASFVLFDIHPFTH